jgi:hypothetical protein
MLYLVAYEGVKSRDELIERARRAHDFKENVVLHRAGLHEVPDPSGSIEDELEGLRADGLLTTDGA